MPPTTFQLKLLPLRLTGNMRHSGCAAAAQCATDCRRSSGPKQEGAPPSLPLSSLSPPPLPLHPAAVSSARSGALRASASVFACMRLIRGDITGGQGEPEEVVVGEELTEWGRQGGTRARPAAKSKNRGSEWLGSRREDDCV